MMAEKMLHRKQMFLKQALREQDQIILSNKTLKGELKSAHNELYSKSKPIRVTDDDYSTIIVSLGKLYGKISNFPPSCKSVLDKSLTTFDLISITDRLFPFDKDNIRELFLHRDTQVVDYALVGLLVEKYITESITRDVFEKGIHMDNAVNDGYNTLATLFEASGHGDWVKELRLKSARATFELLVEKQDPATVWHIKRGKEQIVQQISQGLMALYTDQEVIQTRIEKIVNMAAELCLPLNGQDTPVEIYYLSNGDKVIDKQVKRVYKPLEQEQSKIFLSIAPVFLAKSTSEGDEDVVLDSYKENYSLVYAGRAIW